MKPTDFERLGGSAGSHLDTPPATRFAVPSTAPTATPCSPDEAIALWKQAMRIQVAAYFQSLRDRGASPVQLHKVKGRSFIEVTIEGMRFKGQVRKGPVLVAGDAVCALSSASIAHSAELPAGEHQWAVCNYRTQRRIPLGALSPSGVRALACEFGLVIHGEGASDMVSESECFVNSLAYLQLQAWIVRFPLLANRLLQDFPEFLGRARSAIEPRPRSRYRRLSEFPYLAGMD